MTHVEFRLKYFFYLIFIVFIADGPHFYRMFKMVLIFAIRVLFNPVFVTLFK